MRSRGKETVMRKRALDGLHGAAGAGGGYILSEWQSGPSLVVAWRGQQGLRGARARHRGPASASRAHTRRRPPPLLLRRHRLLPRFGRRCYAASRLAWRGDSCVCVRPRLQLAMQLCRRLPQLAVDPIEQRRQRPSCRSSTRYREGNRGACISGLTALPATACLICWHQHAHAPAASLPSHGMPRPAGRAGARTHRWAGGRPGLAAHQRRGAAWPRERSCAA